MKLKLTKPLCFFDLETTGTDVSKDRIIEIAIIKVNTDGSRESLEIRLNPGIPIPPESTLIHGITDEMVANEPKFKDKARNIYNFLKGCDLAGFNSDRFDIPLLVEELLREISGWKGALKFDKSRPDGSPRKVMNNDRIHKLGWHHSTQLKMGLQQAYNWFSDNQDIVRR